MSWNPEETRRELARREYRPPESPEKSIAQGEPYVVIAINDIYQESTGRAIRRISGVLSCVWWFGEFVIKLVERTPDSAARICEDLKEVLPPHLPHFVKIEPEIRTGK